MSLYYIASGSVEIYLQKGTTSHKIHVLQPEDPFGWIGFIGGIRRTASAKCLSYSRIYKLSRVKFIQRLESYPRDKQIFHQHRDMCVLQGQLDTFAIKCYICESKSHVAELCSKTHYMVSDDVILATLKEVNTRTNTFKRKHKPKFKASQ